MISLLLVDDHTAVRAGLLALVRGEPGFTAIGSADGCEEALVAVRREMPDVVVLDYQLPDGDGLSLCRALKRFDPAPAVLVYSAFAGERLALASVVAGADGLLEKGAPADELFDAIRAVAGGSRVETAIDEGQRSAAAAALATEDLPIFGMLIERTPAGEIAATLRLHAAELEHRIDVMLRRLAPAIDGQPARRSIAPVG